MYVVPIIEYFLQGSLIKMKVRIDGNGTKCLKNQPSDVIKNEGDERRSGKENP